MPLRKPRARSKGRAESAPTPSADGHKAGGRVPRGGIALTPDQERAQEAIFGWLRAKGKQVLTLGGFAGTGKTTVIAETINRLEDRPSIGFCCFTGKAADVLRSKIVAADALQGGDYVGTIHGLIYELDEDAGKKTLRWRKRERIRPDLLVVDEASMVSNDIWNDLCSFGVPILAVGDHGQLPPVGDRYNLMENPDVRLEIIHRQAQASPIVRLSMMARLEGTIPVGDYGPGVLKTRDAADAPWRMPLGKTMFLCGRNRTRIALNAEIRRRLDIESVEPVVGDRVICLRNSRKHKVFNGMLGSVESLSPAGEQCWSAEIAMDSDIRFGGNILRAQFGLDRTLDFEEAQGGCLFDWGYALTVHKAQGSEAPHVVLFEERFSQMTDDEWRRWLYTGVTRASRDLVIIGA